MRVAPVATVTPPCQTINHSPVRAAVPARDGNQTVPRLPVTRRRLPASRSLGRRVLSYTGHWNPQAACPRRAPVAPGRGRTMPAPTPRRPGPVAPPPPDGAPLRPDRTRTTAAPARNASDAPRLQLVLARAGVASRREAERLIIDGRVSVDGVTVQELGTRADPLRHRIAVDGRPIARAVAPRYLMLNKPPGYVTTADDPDGRPTVMQLVPPVPGLFPVGRLDVASEGLILRRCARRWRLAQTIARPAHG